MELQGERRRGGGRRAAVLPQPLEQSVIAATVVECAGRSLLRTRILTDRLGGVRSKAAFDLMECSAAYIFAPSVRNTATRSETGFEKA